jgi:hypothetical protein
MRVVLLFCVGCTTLVAPPARVDDASIRYRDQTTASVQRVEFTADGVVADGKRVPREALQSVRFLSPGSPRLRGAGEGALIGGSAGMIGCAVWGFELNRRDALGPVGAIVGGGFGLAAGALLGAVAGAIAGHHDKVDFTLPR